MPHQETKSLVSAAILALLGAVAGIAISTWWLAPKHSQEDLRIAEVKLRAKIHEDDMVSNLAALKGQCKDGVVKATPTGLIGVCDGGRWSVPGDPELNQRLELQAMEAQQLSGAKL